MAVTGLLKAVVILGSPAMGLIHSPDGLRTSDPALKLPAIGSPNTHRVSAH